MAETHNTPCLLSFNSPSIWLLCGLCSLPSKVAGCNVQLSVSVCILAEGVNRTTPFPHVAIQ
ncbi:unknown [Bacteroides faecis CAG:32]|nr:unknown [Bacteroides faecis CAG:32]